MCGIVATLSQTRPPDPSRLRRGLEVLHHRGPDGSGLWVDFDQNVGLGHARLAIVDLETGSQPLQNEDGTIRAVVNGEFYADDVLRKRLEDAGHQFATRSDSELLLHLYEQYGIDALSHLRGEFAFVLWDAAKRRLFAARDRFGIKPLVWTHGPNGLLLASEAKALFAMGHEARWDATSFLHAAAHQYLPQDRSLFAAVKQLPPGCALVAERGGVREFRYWDLDYPTANQACIEADPDATGELRAKLEQAVRLRLRADVPVACSLSGGIDSASIAALANLHSTRPVPCFGVSFGHAPYDEAAHAQEIAKHIGTRFEIVPVGQEDLLDVLSDAVWHGEGLAINGQFPAKFLLAKAIANAGYKVVLTGEGADEALFGYAHLAQDALTSLPVTEATELRTRIEAARNTQAGVMLPSGNAPGLSAIRSALDSVPTFIDAKAGLGIRLQSLLTDDWRGVLHRFDPFAALLKGFDVAGQLEGRRPVEQSAHLWTRLALAGYILRTLGDGTEMAHSVEGRPPFLDHELFAYCRDLPLEAKFHRGLEKVVLRSAVRTLLPASVVDRGKQPFLAPPVTRFRTPRVRAQIRDSVASRSFADMPFFDAARVGRMLDRLETADAAEQTAAEPALMMALCGAALQERFRLGDPQ